MALTKKSTTKLKSKFVTVYEGFFAGDDPSTKNQQFWDELLMVRVNVDFLFQTITNISEASLLNFKGTMNKLLTILVQYIRDESNTRALHALQTIAAILRALFRKKFTTMGYDVINLLCDFDKANAFFADMIQAVKGILEQQHAAATQQMAIKLMVVLATASENINQNTLLEYFMLTDVFDALLTVFRSETGAHTEALFLLVILASYQKDERANSYRQRLGELAERETLQTFVNVITRVFSECNAMYAQAVATRTAPSVVGGMWAWVSTTVWGPATTAQPAVSNSPSSAGAALLAMYELIYSNKAFLSGIVADPAREASPQPDASPSAPPRLGSMKFSATAAAPAPAIEGGQFAGASAVLTEFLRFASFLVRDVKDARSLAYTRLVLLIISCLCENPSAALLIHDGSVHIDVQIDRDPKRPPVVTEPGAPLASYIIEIVVNFLHDNLKRSYLSSDMYPKAIMTLLKLFQHERRYHTRLIIQWNEVWRALFRLLTALNSDDVLKRPNTVSLVQQVVRLLNYFISYGDKFLPDAKWYDELFVELVRNANLFDQIAFLVDKYDTTGGIRREFANISLISSHFSKKIEEDTSFQGVSSPSREQIMQIIVRHYDTLTLREMEVADRHERYAETTSEASFFQQLVRTVVSDFRGAMALE